MQNFTLKITIVRGIIAFWCQNAKAQCHIDDWTALKAFYEINFRNLSTGYNSTISYGNNFDATWEEFLYGRDGSGACESVDYSTGKSTKI